MRRTVTVVMLGLVLLAGLVIGASLQGARVYAEPNPGVQVHLPVLNFLGQDEVCDTWIEVQNVGEDFTKAVLLTWGAPGFCPPQCSGPLKAECSGLLKPGATWNFLGNQIPGGSKSAMVFSLTAAQLSDFNLDELFGFDDVIADLFCETLFFQVVGDCDDYRRFKKAFNEGGLFAGFPMDIAVGQPLAVEVLRKCPGSLDPSALVTSAYPGVSGAILGVYDPVFGGFAFYAPLLYADKGQFTSIIYLQNGGLECSSVEIWFQEQDNCLRATICEVFTVAPGETAQFAVNQCVGPGWQGSAWIRASQPMGIVVDIVGPDILMSYVGNPSELNFIFNGLPFFTLGSEVAFGPLIYSEFQGWDSGVQVQNLSSIVAAKVKVYFLDRSGDIITTMVDWVCPRGSQTFFLPVLATLPGNWVGTVRVESQEWWSPGDPKVLGPNIKAVAQLIKYADVARLTAEEAIAYNLFPEAQSFDWQLGPKISEEQCAGITDIEDREECVAEITCPGIGCVGLIAIPSLLKDLRNTGVTTEIALANLVPKPGFTDVAIFIYDQNGLLDFVCEKLNEKQVEYIDLQSWGYINQGFKGSAIISATFFEHPVFSKTGVFLDNLIGLAAVKVERTGVRLGDPIAGDESAGSEAFPVLNDFHFQGPQAPRCPGQPAGGVGVQCPDFLQAGCTDCPLSILDNSTTTSRLTVQTPVGCRLEISDVDVFVDITHTFDGDLEIDLQHVNEATQNRLMDNQCGASDNINAIFDDEGAVLSCPPVGGARFRPFTPLTAHDGRDPAGQWELRVADIFFLDTGSLNNWRLDISVD